MNKIIVAYDGSEQALKAFNYAVNLAEKEKASLVVVAVAEPMMFQDDVETETTIDEEQEKLKAGYDSISKYAVEKNIPIRLELRAGHPADQIINVAEKEKADLIILGHRGKSVIKRWLLGSVSKRVISYAGCSVMIVR